MKIKNIKWVIWLLLCIITHVWLTEYFGGNLLPGSLLEVAFDIVFAGNILYCLNQIGEE